MGIRALMRAARRGIAAQFSKPGDEKAQRTLACFLRYRLSYRRREPLGWRCYRFAQTRTSVEASSASGSGRFDSEGRAMERRRPGR